MKRKLAIILAMAMVMGSLTACGNKKENIDEDASTKAEADVVLLNDYAVEDMVTLGNYKDFEISVAPVQKITAEDVQASVDSVWENSVATIGIKDRAVANGDNICLDYEGKKDGEAFQGGTANGAFLKIGSGRFIEGFEEGLVGVKPGETVDLNLAFPENYPSEDLAGQAVVFTVTVNYIVPEMNDANVAALENASYKTVAELEAYVREGLESQAQSQYETSIQSELITKMVNGCTFKDMPAELVDKYKANIRANMEQAAAYYGYDVDTYAAMLYGSDADTAAATYANESAKQGVAFQTIANAENLNVTDEELNTKLQDMAAASGMTVEEYTAEASLEEYREYFMMMNVMEFLKNNATITETTEE